MLRPGVRLAALLLRLAGAEPALEGGAGAKPQQGGGQQVQVLDSGKTSVYISFLKHSDFLTATF